MCFIYFLGGLLKCKTFSFGCKKTLKKFQSFLENYYLMLIYYRNKFDCNILFFIFFYYTFHISILFLCIYTKYLLFVYIFNPGNQILIKFANIVKKLGWNILYSIRLYLLMLFTIRFGCSIFSIYFKIKIFLKTIYIFGSIKLNCQNLFNLFIFNCPSLRWTFGVGRGCLFVQNVYT